MQSNPSTASVPTQKLGVDFWKFWAGQTISNLGSSFTGFALPLLVFKLTGSALNLALATAFHFIPYLLFGLVIGAWVDRVDRKRLMIATDIARAVVIASIPALAAIDRLSIWWIYAVGFTSSTLSICFDAAEFAAIPSLTSRGDPSLDSGQALVTANGRIQASYSAASVLGPLLAGLLIAVLPVQDALYVDGASFIVSALSLALIKASFNVAKKESEKKTTIRQDVAEGLRYVLSHPVLRNISAMMAMVNFVGSTVGAQAVLFAKEQLRATDSQVGILFSAGSVGVVVLSLAAGPLRKRWPFSKVALSALMIEGLLTIALSQTHIYWIGLLLWALSGGLGILFNINTGSLRQAIVPNHMLGRVISIAGVLAWSAIPLGAFLGGIAVDKTKNISLIYAVIGALIFIIPLAFYFTPLGRAERYLPKKEASSEQDEAVAAEPAQTVVSH